MLVADGLHCAFAIDTTAHTLDATVGFLALYPELQEEVFQELMEVMPTEADMVRPVPGNLHAIKGYSMGYTMELFADVRKLTALGEDHVLFRRVVAVVPYVLFSIVPLCTVCTNDSVFACS